MFKLTRRTILRFAIAIALPSAVVVVGIVAVLLRGDGSTQAGGLGQNVQPGIIVATPTAISLPAGSNAVATLTQDAAIQRVLSSDSTIDRGSAHAELHRFNELNKRFDQLGDSPNRYVPDYPVWVVTVDGDFTREVKAPPGKPIPNFTHATYYLDGLTGDVIARDLSSGSPTPPPASAAARTPGDSTATSTPAS